MPELTNELKYIWSWLESTNLEFIDCYNPGLTQQQIDGIVKDLPFRLNEEVYELYKWRNGRAALGFNNYYSPVDFLFPEQLRSDVNCPFCSLQDSVCIYNTLREATNFDDEYWNQNWFPIASFENKRMLYVIGDLETSPVCLWDVDCLHNPVRTYKNLTTLLSVIAECCELSLYQVVPDEYGEEGSVVIRINEERLDFEKAVYAKYNS